MRTSTRLGIAGSGVAVAGSAALAALAPGAVAAPGQARATPAYHSTATAEVGTVAVGHNQLDPLRVTATNANSPQDKKYTLAVLLAELNDVPVLGPAVGGALQTASPSILELASAHATASADGVSTACATTLQASCESMPSPVILKIKLDALSSILDTLPTPIPNLPEFALVLTLQGPQASCEAGPAGSGKLSGNAAPAGATAQITENDSPIAGPVTLSGGDVWTALAGEADPALAPALNLLATGAPLNLTLDHGSTSSPSGSAVTATSGELGLSTANATLLHVGGVTVHCGPNTLSGSAGPGPGSSGTGSGTGGEKPLGGIQSDEGRSSAPARSWLALNGMP